MPIDNSISPNISPRSGRIVLPLERTNFMRCSFIFRSSKILNHLLKSTPLNVPLFSFKGALLNSDLSTFLVGSASKL